MVIEPELPIVDAHHHVRDRPGDSYLFPDLRADLARGHAIRATVAVECGDMYRAFGPEALRSVGETEFLAGVAAMFASGRYGPKLACAAIVGYADLRLGREVDPVLDALVAASGGRLRGLRNPVAWHPDPELRRTRHGPEGILRDPRFREGVARLGERGLSFDAWIYHTQLADFAELADKCAGTTLILNHVGGPLGAGPYAGRRGEVFAAWREALRALARRPNVVCKVGGLGLPIMGLHVPAGSGPDAYATAWRPYVETAIEAFGAHRCMLESNFPSDRDGADYASIWSAFKHVTAACAPHERAQLFSGTAIRVYRLAEALAAAGESLPGRG